MMFMLRLTNCKNLSTFVNPTDSKNLFRYRLPFFVAAMTLLVQLVLPAPAQAVQTQAVQTGIQSTSDVRASSLGDEAFTEPIETIQVASAESGIIDRVNVKRGDFVEEGQLLVELDKRVLAASLRLAQAKASSTAKLKAAQIEWETKASNYDKLVGLIKDSAASPKEVESAQSSAQVAKQNVEAIREELEQFSLEAERIESQIEQRSVRSPITGVVTDVRKKNGEYVSVSDPHLVTVVRLDLLRVVFFLSTQKASHIAKGHVAELWMSETRQKAHGIVEYVAPVTQADSGRVRLEILVHNPELKFRSGVRCQIINTSIRQSMKSLPRARN